MDEFFVEGECKPGIHFHSPQVNSAGWVERYIVTVHARNLQASLLVENPPYGRSPHFFFKELASNWQPERGVYNWVAIEHEFGLSAGSDGIGHITLTVSLGGHLAENWCVKATVMIEAGQLDGLARKAGLFFNEHL